MKIKKVLVSQPKPTSDKSPYFDIAEKYGVEIVFRPFIKVESLSAKEFRQQKVSILDHTESSTGKNYRSSTQTTGRMNQTHGQEFIENVLLQKG